MQNVHHRPLKMFSIDGTIHDDSALVRLKPEYERLLVIEMRELGYVPRIDIISDFTLAYSEKDNHFEFKLSVYGIYVGKKRSQWISGIDETRVVHTQKIKSKESL